MIYRKTFEEISRDGFVSLYVMTDQTNSLLENWLEDLPQDVFDAFDKSGLQLEYFIELSNDPYYSNCKQLWVTSNENMNKAIFLLLYDFDAKASYFGSEKYSYTYQELIKKPDWLILLENGGSPK